MPSNSTGDGVNPPLTNNDNDRRSDLGRKVRQRTIEERSKRHEIVRLEQAPLFLKKTPTKSTPLALASKRKRRRPASQLLSATTKKGSKSSHARSDENVDDTFDTWVPSVAHLVAINGSNNNESKNHNDNSEDCGDDSKSQHVLLHGLPVGVCYSDVRNFFSGLDPQRVLLVIQPSVTCDNICSIPQLDADYSVPRVSTASKHEQRAFVPRYESGALRVIVSFATAAIANLAVQRSGEPMSASQSSHGTTAAVAVTLLIPKTYVSAILNLAIDVSAKTSCNETLFETVTRIQQTSSLHPAVTGVLWQHTRDKLGLDIQGWNEQNDNPVASDCMSYTIEYLVQHEEAFERVKQYVTRLVDLRQDILDHDSFPFAIATTARILDPSVNTSISDPAVYLSNKACNVLQEMIDKIGKDVIQTVYQWKKLRHANNPLAIMPIQT